MIFAVAAASIALLNGLPVPHTSMPASLGTRADTSASFAWNGAIQSGGWLRIRNLAGSVEVRRASGNTVEVHADRERDTDRWLWNSGPTESVRFVAERHGSDVVICAISRSVPRCDADDVSSPDMGWSDNWRPQPMHVVVQLPAGISLQAGTMHGDLTISDAGAMVRATTGHGNVNVVNAAAQVTANTGHGDINVSANGAVHASTGHGDIVADIAPNAILGANDLAFDTGHGNIRVRAPKSLHGDVDLRTGHGRVSSDFPLTMDAESRHERSGSAHGAVGGGGPSVRLSSGHGDVSLTTGS